MNFYTCYRKVKNLNMSVRRRQIYEYDGFMVWT